MNPLQTLTNGMTTYVSAHNNNYANVKSAIDALEAQSAVVVASSLGLGAAFPALFGTTYSVIGVGSYACTGSGTNLTVAAGFVWKASVPIVVKLLIPATLSFTGQSAATYYISADLTGAPVRSTTVGVDDLYSVVWTGTAFGAITRIAQIVWGAADDIAAQISSALGVSYTSLDARFEAGELVATAAKNEVIDARNSLQP